MIFENTFSDYELYQILEGCKYKTTEKNLKILKEGLKSGKYYIEDQLDSLLLQEFQEYLNEDPLILDEETLNEGVLLNKIRWKLALFSLRFLSNTSIDAFFIAYYADKSTGKPTDKGKEFCRKSRKEKLAKMRELANGMKEEDKQKVINSQAAKQCEKSALVSGIAAGVAGANAGIMYNTASKIGSIKQGTDSGQVTSVTNTSAYGYTGGNAYKRDNNHASKYFTANGDKGNVVQSYETRFVPEEHAANRDGWHYDSYASAKTVDYSQSKDYTPNIRSELPYYSEKGSGKNVAPGSQTNTSFNYGGNFGTSTVTSMRGEIGSKLAATFASISSLLYTTMWGSIIIAGISVVKGVLSLHKANTIRRDEIMDELKSKMDPNVAKQLAKQYKQEFKQEKKNKH